MTANRLSAETSPYLLQHADNPVHWHPWDDTALETARAENKPILLSVGYAACHWCHVMAHESFENPTIAEIMNRHFISIKVDREERPDLDAVYQRALAHLGQQGGWPLTMFLTPDREPFWGGTYFPPDGRWGRPGFADVLNGVAETYAREPEKVSQNVTALRGALAQMAAPGEPTDIRPEIRDRIATHLVGQFDPINGGMNGAPKFPQPQALDLLIQAHYRQDDNGATQFGDLAWLTLRRMSQGGIYESFRWRFRALFSRRTLACAAFRKDAVRQCAIAQSTRRCLASHPRLIILATCRRNCRVAGPRDAGATRTRHAGPSICFDD